VPDVLTELRALAAYLAYLHGSSASFNPSVQGLISLTAA